MGPRSVPPLSERLSRSPELGISLASKSFEDDTGDDDEFNTGI